MILGQETPQECQYDSLKSYHHANKKATVSQHWGDDALYLAYLAGMPQFILLWTGYAY
jgi:formate-dependent nitrite reductase cytochrome c552 subunit